jgi:putative flavoprotein involved in K+ transport
MIELRKVVRTHTLVIGAGQAGLAVGYHLAKRGMPFVIVDANKRIGDAWRNRWDSLRLFTPARYVGLPGLPFSGKKHTAPTKEEMADYLEGYAIHFGLPVRTEVRVERLTKERGKFVAMARGLRFEADNVVVAMANYQSPHVPEFAKELAPRIMQLHSHDYRNVRQLQSGSVLVVGAGNSGADIAMEVAKTHATWMAGKESGHIPFPIDSLLARLFLIRLVRFIGHHVLTLGTPIGRKQRSKMLGRAAPLVRVKPKWLAKAGVQRVGRIAGVRNGLPLLEHGRTLDVKNVIWCTGYRAGFSWIELPIFRTDGQPEHERGVVSKVPGMHFVGLHYLYSMTSATLIGVGRDAEYVVKAIEQQPRNSNSLKAAHAA